MSSSDQPFWDAVDALRERDGRYQREAYGFVVGALGVAVRALPAERRSDPVRRHLTGGELLTAIIRIARDEFGTLAATVFREWGITSGEDVGRIVFQLVESKQLSARREDSIDAFLRGGELFAALTANLDFGPARPTDERLGRVRPREPGTKG